MRLTDWRKNQDKSQADIAPLLGVKVSQLSKIERGETFVSPKTADAIRRVTDGAVTVNDLHDQWREYQVEKSGEAAE